MTSPALGWAAEVLGTMGGRAVWLFFVLSGVVLARFAASGSSFDYGPYLLSRLARLYVPVAAAVLFATATVWIVPRGTSGYGPWIDSHPSSLTVSGVVADLTLVGGTSGTLSPLWSLQWEVLFSVFLILYVASLRRVPAWVGVCGGMSLSAIGASVGSNVLLYMPMFAIGVSLGLAWDEIAVTIARWRSLLPRPVVAVTVIVLLTAAAAQPELTSHFQFSPLPEAVSDGLDAAASLAAVTTVTILVGLDPALNRIFRVRPMQWLGVISFSLYLVHEPILIGVVRLTGASVVTVALATVLCFLAAAGFSRLVERPAHRYSQSLRRAAAVSLE